MPGRPETDRATSRNVGLVETAMVAQLRAASGVAAVGWVGAGSLWGTSGSVMECGHAGGANSRTLRGPQPSARSAEPRGCNGRTGMRGECASNEATIHGSRHSPHDKPTGVGGLTSPHGHSHSHEVKLVIRGERTPLQPIAVLARLACWNRLDTRGIPCALRDESQQGVTRCPVPPQRWRVQRSMGAEAAVGRMGDGTLPEAARSGCRLGSPSPSLSLRCRRYRVLGRGAVG